ncbi:uncharacterized protein LY89DRAFT_419426 [Mollisia scopiformis]|uniref:Uncharacterized protein n=1 Tax=Mollisia scopiformis TaxID=149040 RepID=A0A194XL76_MOLSC|nr:uncharacterized protein LY89DRAFT_419426 [Mollisia scopiformis]KUJ20928.1 hypothetical protein LY89DRAFT_419426 [Mollisia scopiformis]
MHIPNGKRGCQNSKVGATPPQHRPSSPRKEKPRGFKKRKRKRSKSTSLVTRLSSAGLLLLCRISTFADDRETSFEPHMFPG